MGRRRKKQKITAEFVEKENNEAKSENIKDFNIIDQKTVDISINDDENGMVYTQENRELSSRESSPVSALSMRGKINVVELSDFDVADDSEGIGILTDNEEKYESQEELNEKIYESQTRKKSEKNEVLDSFVVSRFDPSSSNVVCYKEKDDNFDLCLIAMKRGESIRFQGSALVASIYGDAVIMGYRLCGVSFEDASESLQIDLNSSVVFHPVFSPKTHSLLAIESTCLKEDMIPFLLCKNEKKDDESKKSKYDFFNIKGFYPIFEAAPGMTALKIPHSWENSVNQLVADILDFTLPPISITSGHKNVGKSTFSRYLVNNLLNVCPKVAYIESDVGQSEFTPCGLVSLNILDSPIFGPPFTHIQQPYRSYFIGHNSPRDDPDYYLECLRELITVYRRDIACGPEYGMYGDEQIRIPLIINTHGWSKGMGYDLYLHIISFAKPTHIFQFYSATITNKNLPPLPEYIVSPNDQEPPKVSFIETIDTPGPSNKYSASDRRILSLFSYFYSTSAMAIKQENVKWWAFDQPLVRRVPWCLDWRKGLTKGIFMLSGEVPLSQLLYALNGSIVGLIGDIDNSCTIEQVDEEMNESKEEGSQIIPNYFPCPDFSPPSPTECTCLGLAIIRSIDPTSHTFHILTPLPSMVLFKTNTIVKGTLELPVWLMLDHTKNSSLGVHGIQWKRAPYMSIESGGGVGNAAQKIRRNIKRRGQKSNK
ncbi:AAA family ATPase Grc3 [Rhizophagus clarus]|uniref:Polynucleotide 5'-hydroxyl-kinase GRC3 n=1 Tax=Rhizophagus clarus TaxID=94130 RepID=A0A8H3M6Q0_9GLOM|nr:AAA family ATPase Grc3 [Rhizophagus clarus]